MFRLAFPTLVLVACWASGSDGTVPGDWLATPAPGFTAAGALLANDTGAGLRFWTGYDPDQQLFRLNSQAPALPLATWQRMCLETCEAAASPLCAGVFFATGLWCAGLAQLGPPALAPTQQLSVSVRRTDALFTGDNVTFAQASCPQRCERCETAGGKMACTACSDPDVVLHAGRCVDRCPPGWLPTERPGAPDGEGGSGDGSVMQAVCERDPCHNVTCSDETAVCHGPSMCRNGVCEPRHLADGSDCINSGTYNACVGDSLLCV